MKPLFQFAVSLGLTTLLYSAFALAAAEPIVVKVSGMTCGNCVEKISEAMKGIEGIQPGSVEVSLKGQTARLKVANADQKTIDAIRSAIEKMKYTVEDIQVESQKPKIDSKKKS